MRFTNPYASNWEGRTIHTTAATEPDYWHAPNPQSNLCRFIPWEKPASFLSKNSNGPKKSCKPLFSHVKMKNMAWSNGAESGTW